MYLELSIKNNQESSRLQLAFLQKLYILLDEPDGVAGVAASRQEDPTLHDLILGHEATGQLQDAFFCYERAVKVKPDTISHHQGLLRCLMGLDQSNTALTYATGLLNERPEWSNEINPFRVESAWKLADWDGLSEFLKSLRKGNKCRQNQGEKKSLSSLTNQSGSPLQKDLHELRVSLSFKWFLMLKPVCGSIHLSDIYLGVLPGM
ncbi:serine/threonine-protein kinase atr-like [Tachypleus tridentatus]|uniref:serine/threonine-protein kinase atr-like n=1 Tax=Tachypleus tridentatus TaxID=6853 RepID=UPI003FCF7856